MRLSIVSAQVSPCSEPGDPGWSGQAVHVRELAEALAGDGHQVTVLARRDDPSRPDTQRPCPGLTICHLDVGPAAPIRDEDLVAVVPELADRLRERWQLDPQEVVHAHDWTSGMAAGGAARDLGVATVQTFHTAFADVEDPGGRAGAEQAVARSAGRVVATSEDDLFGLLRRGAPRPRLRVVPAGIDVESWRPAGPTLRRTTRPRLLVLGSLAEGDGADEAVEALRTVPGAELFVAGGPAPERADDDPDLARLHRLAARVGVARRVRFLGAVSRDDVGRLLRSADALVSAPQRTSSGIAALEAMACGRAVVATAVGGLRDAVVDQVTGVQVLPGRPADLASALREVLGDPATSAAFGIAGRDRAVARFDRVRIVRSMIEVYREAIAGCRAAAAGGGIAESG